MSETNIPDEEIENIYDITDEVVTTAWLNQNTKKMWHDAVGSRLILNTDGEDKLVKSVVYHFLDGNGNDDSNKLYFIYVGKKVIEVVENMDRPR